jgi:FAD/FMN-containing dehydrogenase
LQVTIITADGSILTASETENPDLFFGIRGGGSNFGVCTEFVIRLHYQRPRVFGGMAAYPLEILERGLIAVTDEWWANGPSEREGMIHLFTKGLNGEVS